MAADRRLLKLHEALRRCSAPPNRVVTMVARVTPVLGVGIRDLPALDRGAGIPGGRVLPAWMDGAGTLEIVAWNTGEASDLRRYGNRSYAEAQFFEFMRDREFKSVDIEISHSPCTACADMLVGLLRSMKAKGTTVTQGTNRRVGQRIYVGSAIETPPAIPATLRWGALFETPPQATRRNPFVRYMMLGGKWQRRAPRSQTMPGPRPSPCCKGPRLAGAAHDWIITRAAGGLRPLPPWRLCGKSRVGKTPGHGRPLDRTCAASTASGRRPTRPPKTRSDSTM